MILHGQDSKWYTYVFHSRDQYTASILWLISQNAVRIEYSQICKVVVFLFELLHATSTAQCQWKKRTFVFYSNLVEFDRIEALHVNLNGQKRSDDRGHGKQDEQS